MTTEANNILKATTPTSSILFLDFRLFSILRVVGRSIQQHLPRGLLADPTMARDVAALEAEAKEYRLQVCDRPADSCCSYIILTDTLSSRRSNRACR
jgi:hypothetical protein